MDDFLSKCQLFTGPSRRCMTSCPGSLTDPDWNDGSNPPITLDVCKVGLSPGRAAGYPNGPPTDPDEPN